MAWPGGAVLEPPGLTSTGPGATSPGLDLVAALDPDRTHVDVYERLLLRPGATTLDLAPAELGGLGPSLGIPADTVRDLQIELDGHAVRPARHGSGWHVTAPDGAGITRAVLRYRLTGVVLRQEPAPPGRVTIVLRPLGAAAMLAAHDPVTVRVEGPGVGTLTCPTSRSRLLCGAPAGDAGLAMLPADATAVVLAQVTRP
jgi:hypothetical protein